MAIETAPKATLLIVDDNLFNLDLLSKFLGQSGFEILSAIGGNAALERARYAQPDMILLDVMMPDVNGFETCKQLKDDETTQDIPVIFMTGLTDVESKVEGFSVGAVDYVTKPIQRRELLARVNTHLTLRNLQKKLEAEITERKKIEEDLRQSADKLQARNEELDAFAHTVAHNLQNPLGALTGIAEILVEDFDRTNPEVLKEHLAAIARSGNKASNIVNELLLLANVRKRKVKAVPLDLAHIIEEAQERLYDMIEKSEAKITTPSEWPVVLGYAPWIEEVWVNYISNAIKYGGTPPHMELGFNPPADGQITFWIKDNGPGLTPEEQSKLFTPFTRLRKMQAHGHGLGLSIVRRIVEKLGGQVGVESAGVPGQGTTFTFSLPTPDS